MCETGGGGLETCPECGAEIHAGFKLANGTTVYHCPNPNCEGEVRRADD